MRSSLYCGALLMVLGAARAEPMPSGQLGAYPMTRDGSGTSWLPDAAPMDAWHGQLGDWSTMLHGALTLADTDQGGPRGASATYSESAIMGSLARRVGDDRVAVRAMLSAEPVNGAAGYPLLLQTGESADGRTPLVDRQHPHNLVMELASSYAHSLNSLASLFVYAAPVGEPALGPPAFMHRPSSSADPEAPLSHHHLDATHVTFGVLTAGVVAGAVKVEGSWFNGREPDQHRSALEWRRFDSWSARVSVNPLPSLALQVSTAALASPEALQPRLHERRTTASLLAQQSWGDAEVATTLAVGRNTPSVGAATTAWLLDQSWHWDSGWTVYGRYEQLADDALNPAALVTPPTVRKASVGVERTVLARPAWQLAAGGVASRYRLPDDLAPWYGGDPSSWTAYLRLKLAP